MTYKVFLFPKLTYKTLVLLTPQSTKSLGDRSHTETQTWASLVGWDWCGFQWRAMHSTLSQPLSLAFLNSITLLPLSSPDPNSTNLNLSLSDHPSQSPNVSPSPPPPSNSTLSQNPITLFKLLLHHHHHHHHQHLYRVQSPFLLSSPYPSASLFAFWFPNPSKSPPRPGSSSPYSSPPSRALCWARCRSGRGPFWASRPPLWPKLSPLQRPSAPSRTRWFGWLWFRSSLLADSWRPGSGIESLLSSWSGWERALWVCLMGSRSVKCWLRRQCLAPPRGLVVCSCRLLSHSHSLLAVNPQVPHLRNSGLTSFRTNFRFAFFILFLFFLFFMYPVTIASQKEGMAWSCARICNK